MVVKVRETGVSHLGPKVRPPRKENSPGCHPKLPTISQNSNVLQTFWSGCLPLTSSRTKQDKKIPSTKSNGSSTSLPYMGLPLEIWCQICRLVVEKESPISVSFRRINHSPRRCNSRTTLALASTCRLMYKVAIPFYYSRNTFFIPGRTVEQKSFLASIGPINRDLITSLEIDAYYPPRDIWQQISKLAATKNFSALYHHGLIRSSPPGEVDGEASFDYCRIIDSFSAVLGDKKEPPKSPNCTINLHNSDRRRLDSGLVKTDGARFWKRHTYPWGVLEAIFQGKRMTINIERSGKEKRS